jgi:hypothetical protein
MKRLSAELSWSSVITSLFVGGVAYAAEKSGFTLPGTRVFPESVRSRLEILC